MADAAPFIIQDVRIFTGEEVIPNGYVYVSDGQIKSFGHGAPQDVPLNVQIYAKPGHTLLPGFLDCHIHAWMGDENALSIALKYGVTTTLDMHNEHEPVRKLKKLVAEKGSGAKYADFKTACLAASVEKGYPTPIAEAFSSPELDAAAATWVKLKSPDETDAYIDDQIRAGADYIKILQESGAVLGLDLPVPTPELQKAIIDAAHRRGLKAVAHAQSLRDTILVLEAGIDGMAHTFCDEPPTDELIAAYKKNNAWCCPTLSAFGSLTATRPDIMKAFTDDERVKELLTDQERHHLGCSMGGCSQGSVDLAVESVKALKKANIDIVCGSDTVGSVKPGCNWGITYHHELRLFVEEVGMTPEEALKSATSVPARRFGFTDRGMIAPGLKADLVLVEGNPLDSIRAALDIRGVWRDGYLAKVYSDSI